MAVYRRKSAAILGFNYQESTWTFEVHYNNENLKKKKQGCVALKIVF